MTTSRLLACSTDLAGTVRVDRFSARQYRPAMLAAFPFWSVFNGTLVNAAAVAAGSTAGLVIGPRMPERFQRVVLQALGLITLWLGFDAAINEFQAAVPAPADVHGPRLGLVMVGSMVLGALAGTALRLHDGIEALGNWIHRRFASDSRHSVAEGFLSASVIFCVGPLTLLGCLENGTPPHDPSYLYIKALLDGFCAIALTASLGVGVLFAVFTVVGLQGAFALAAYFAAGTLADPVSLGLMKAVGGLLLLGTGLHLLEIKRLPLADFLPAMFMPPVIIAAVRAAVPHWLA